MRQAFILLLCLISLQSIAQNQRIKVGFQYTQDNISGENFVSDNDNSVGERIFRDEYNYSIGFTTTLLTNSNFSFKSGLLYSNKDLKSIYLCPSCLSIGIPTPDFIKQRFISVPIQLNFRAKEYRISPVFEAGLISNFGLSEGVEFSRDNFLEASFSLGMAYAISESFDIQLSYFNRSAISAIYDSSVGKEPSDPEYKPNRLKTEGFSVNVLYSFN